MLSASARRRDHYLCTYRSRAIGPEWREIYYNNLHW